MVDYPKISIVIPTKNGEDTIEECLNAIFKQTLISQTEVIIIDSGSTDGTLDIAKNFQVRIYEILPEDFGHGKTRNFGVNLAKGEFVVMTVQDARASSDTWLETMLQHFEVENVVAVSGKQAVPHDEDKNPLAWYSPVRKARFHVISFQKGEFEKLTPIEKRKACSLDDVNSMYRKVILNKIPFDDIEFGEDMLWAKNALTDGYTIVYDMRVLVWHYHHYNDMKILEERLAKELYFKYKFFNLIPIKDTHFVKSFLKKIYYSFKNRISIKWLIYNYKIAHTEKLTIKRFLKTRSLH